MFWNMSLFPHTCACVCDKRLAGVDVAEWGAEEGEPVEGDDPVGRVHHRVVQQVAARLHVAIPAIEYGI